MKLCGCWQLCAPWILIPLLGIPSAHGDPVFQPHLEHIPSLTTPGARSRVVRELGELSGWSATRAVEKNVYRTPIGLVFDESCTNVIKQELKRNQSFRRRHFPNESRKDVALVLRKLDNAALEVSRRMLNCQHRYPELRPYLAKWAQMVRKTKVYCDLRSSREWGYGGFSWGGDYLKISGDRFLDLLSESAGDYRSALSVLAHEILHATPSANRIGHDRHDRTPPLDCSDNDAMMDRIYVIEQLCNAGSPRERLNEKSTLELLGERMARCGEARGCTDLFTRSGNNHWLARLNPSWSLDLSLQEARSLCQQIQNDAFCTARRRELASSRLLKRPDYREFVRVSRLSYDERKEIL